MSASKSEAYSIADWEREGFGSPPEEFVALGCEKIFRAYNPDADSNRRKGETQGTSGLKGNCYFVPSFGMQFGPISYGPNDTSRWTGPYLEKYLNAWIFGNDFKRVAIFLLKKGASYSIGRVGQDIRYFDPLTGRVERHLAWPGVHIANNPFRQVIIREKSPIIHMDIITDFPVRGPLSIRTRFFH